MLKSQLPDIPINTIMQFHTLNAFSDEEPYTSLFSNCSSENSKYNFGTIDIQTTAQKPIPYIWDVKFSVDNSGSMSDKCRDGRTKLQHITHTLSNIIRLFVSYKPQKFNVCIQTFNDKLDTVIDFTEVSDENMNTIIAQISAIYDYGSTNLVLPITQTNDQMTARKNEFPDNKRLHIMLTDGLDSCGNLSDTIINAVTSEYETIVFGFGIDHDSQTLSKIGEKPLCSYGFIAEIEKAGIVYGEFLHNVLYRIVTDLSIEMTNTSEVYCWKTNTWKKTLEIGDLASDLKKTYYVRTLDDCDEVSGNLTGVLCSLNNNNTCEILDTICTMPPLILSDDTIEIVDLRNHMYRYKTLQLLYEANQISIPDRREFLWNRRFRKNIDISSEIVIHMKKKLLDFYIDMRTYMITKYPDGCPFLEGLLDDIYVSRMSFENTNTWVYSVARQRTQGNQTVYTPTSVFDAVSDINMDHYTDIPQLCNSFNQINFSGETTDNSQVPIIFPNSDVFTDSSQRNDIYINNYLHNNHLYNYTNIVPQDDDTYNNYINTTFDYIENVTNDPEDVFNNHTLSQFIQEAYTSPTLSTVIRSTSSDM